MAPNTGVRFARSPHPGLPLEASKETAMSKARLFNILVVLCALAMFVLSAGAPGGYGG